MGVPELLKRVDPLLCKTNIYSVARDKRLGIDGHVWMHMLAYHHGQSIVVDNDYSPLALEFVQLCHQILGKGIDLIIVFDGAPTPAKGETDEGRAFRRAKAFAQLTFDGAEADPRLLRAAIKLTYGTAIISHICLHRTVPYRTPGHMQVATKATVITCCPPSPACSAQSQITQSA